ncbi:hypothetical protein [Bdellovibrio sp. HCB2-146]|uniref:hypothetical protein n=1 Tax=Bdellovibrio sp. HCB2-146 TaxID=3394362 RepID=UPI0039BCDCE6
MKKVILMLSTTLLFCTAEAETRDFQKVDSHSAKVVITTDDRDYVQASEYLDGKENQELISMLLADPDSRLAKIRNAIEMQICETNSTPENPWIDQCGQVEFSDLVQTSFARGGWAEGYASYTFFIGFRSDGTGMILESLYSVEVNESIVANIDTEGNYIGTLEKKLTLGFITKLPIQR